MEKKSKLLTILLIVFVIISLLLGCFIIYDKVLNNNSNNNSVIDNKSNGASVSDNKVKFNTIKKVELNDTNQNFVINGKNINLKIKSENNDSYYNLYFNDEKVSLEIPGPGIMSAYVIDSLFAVYWEGSLMSEIIAFLDENGKVLLNPVFEYPSSLNNLHIENNKLMATRDDNGEMDCGIPENASECVSPYDVEVIYNGKSISVERVK